MYLNQQQNEKIRSKKLEIVRLDSERLKKMFVDFFMIFNQNKFDGFVSIGFPQIKKRCIHTKARKNNNFLYAG